MTTRIGLRVAGAFFLALCIGANAQGATPEDDARAFLGHLDAGRYEESWVETAGFVQASTKKEEWAAAMASLREVKGEPAERRFSHKELTFEFPDGPSGQYITLVYATTFTGRPKQAEVLHLYLEADGRYRVAGYGFKKD